MTRPMVRKAERWPWVWGAIATVLLVALAGALVAYSHAASVASCVNSVLATRDLITGELHAADVVRVEGQKRAEAVKADGLDRIVRATTQTQAVDGIHRYVAGEKQFTKTLDDYLDESNRLRAEQLKNPLGKC